MPNSYSHCKKSNEIERKQLQNPSNVTLSAIDIRIKELGAVSQFYLMLVKVHLQS